MDFYYCILDLSGNVIQLSTNFEKEFNNIIHLNNLIDSSIVSKVLSISECIELQSVFIKNNLYIFNCIKTGESITCIIKRDIVSKVNLFLGYVSQEIRNYLNGIMGIIDLLNETPVNNKQNEYIKFINDCSAQLNNILNDLFDYTKIQTHSFKLNKNSFNILECIEEAFDIITLKATQKNIDIYHLENNVPKFILSDKYRLKQILITILEYSIKFSNNFSKIILSLSEKENFLEFTIKLSSFDTSQNIDSVFSFKNNNIQIGLILCKKILENMGGKISADTLGFVFTIPYDTIDYDDEILDNTDLSLKDKSILLFDTDLINKSILFNYLIKWKTKPILCSNDTEVMSYINNFPFDLIIIDLNFNNIKDLIKSIRKVLPDIHIIGTTSSESNLNFESVSKVLIKPITNLKMYNEIISLIGPEYNSKHTPEIQLKNTKLLIIENISHNQEIIISFLKKLGYHDIFLAYTELEAITAAKKNNYDVIFLNLTISNLDYINLVKKINKINKKSLIIGISNNDSAELQRACFKIGINAFLLRPLQFNDLDLLMKAVEDKLRES